MTTRRNLLKAAAARSDRSRSGFHREAFGCAGADHLADADLCRPRPGRARGGPRDRDVQQDRGRAHADRAVLLRSDRAHGRALPRHAARHHRRGAVRRRLHGVADRGHRLRRLLPVRIALFARRARALQPVRPQRDLGCGVREGRRQAHLGGRLGPLPLRDQGPDPFARRSRRQAGLHLPDRRPLPDPVRRGAR